MSEKAYEEFNTGKTCPNCGKPLLARKLAFGGLVIPVECECAIKKREIERKKNVEIGSTFIKQQMLKKCNLKSYWIDKTFEAFKPMKGQEEALLTAKNFADNFYTLKSKSGIMFIGATGCGKTHLASAIVHTVIQTMPISEQEAENAGITYTFSKTCPVQFSSTVDLLSQLKAAYTAGNNATDIINKYKTAPLVILDDFCAEKQSEWVSERIFEIIDWRYSDNLPIIITTNATPEEIKNKMGARTYDRLREMCKVVTISTGSQRQTAR